MNNIFYSPETEKYIIGALILEKHEEIHCIEEQDFYNPDHQLLYRVIKWLKETQKQIDVITVAEWAKKKLDTAYEVAVECIGVVTTISNYNTHYTTLKLYSTKRQIQKKITEATTLLNESEHNIPEDLKNDVLQKLSEVKTPSSDCSYMGICDAMTETTALIEEEFRSNKESKLFVGFKNLDYLTAGLHEQELTIIAARPGVGKTALALNMLHNLARRGNHCLFVSREMSRQQICKRLISIMSGIDSNKLRIPKSLKDDDWATINKSAVYATSLPGEIFIDDRTFHIQGMRSQVRSLRTKGKCDVLIVDYLGLVKTLKKCESRRIEIEDVSWNLKQISKEFNIPVVSLCQLNRGAEGTNEEPQLHHLRESGAIEQDSDNVLMLYEPDESENPFVTQEKDKVLTKVLIRKQRNGPVGSISLLCTKNNFKYYNVD
jgi:replicative DNA helicase